MVTILVTIIINNNNNNNNRILLVKLKPHVVFSMYFHFLPLFICTQKIEKMITAPDKGIYSIFSLEPNLDVNNYRRRYCGMEMTHPSPIAAK